MQQKMIMILLLLCPIASAGAGVDNLNLGFILNDINDNLYDLSLGYHEFTLAGFQGSTDVATMCEANDPLRREEPCMFDQRISIQSDRIRIGSPPPATTSPDSGSEGASCFIAGTKVLMADGSLKNIEDVEIGETVIGNSGINTVMGFERPIIGNRVIYRINDRIECTGDHPFLTTDGWKTLKPAIARPQFRKQLHIGDTILTASGYEAVQSIQILGNHPAEEVVYDLKLDGDSTYVANGFVVHNCDGSVGSGLDASIAADAAAADAEGAASSSVI